MKKEFLLVLSGALLLMGGCSKKDKKTDLSSSAATSRPKVTEKASESPEVSESADVDSQNTVPQKTPVPDQNAEQNPAVAPAQTPVVTSPAGTWQIISYDNGSGTKQSFTPGQDTSIVGSSSIVLNQDGSCEFNLPGMSSEGCSWSGTEIDTNGAQIFYSLNGNEMTVNNAGSVYVFEKTD